MENGPFIDVVPIKMVIFNSYVSLPEGINIMILSGKNKMTCSFPIVGYAHSNNMGLSKPTGFSADHLVLHGTSGYPCILTC